MSTIDDRNLGSAGDRGGFAAGPLQSKKEQAQSLRYADLWDLPHPTSKKHPRMDRLTRAAQFSPFAALTGYNEVLAETERLTEGKRILTEEETEAIGKQLHAIRMKVNETRIPLSVPLTYFLPDKKKEGGTYLSEVVTVKRVDEQSGALLLSDGRRILPEHILEFL